MPLQKSLKQNKTTHNKPRHNQETATKLFFILRMCVDTKKINLNF